MDGHPGRIECARGVWDEITGFVIGGFSRSPSGGPEVGGLLLGARTEGAVRIEGWREIPCEHANGPAFQLSERDEAELRALLTGSPGVVGWFHSKYWDVGWIASGRWDFSLRTADLELYDRYFREPWQVALVIQRARMGVQRIGFFFRKADGSIDSVEKEGADIISAPAPSAEDDRPNSSEPAVLNVVAGNVAPAERSQPGVVCEAAPEWREAPACGAVPSGWPENIPEPARPTALPERNRPGRYVIAGLSPLTKRRVVGVTLAIGAAVVATTVVRVHRGSEHPQIPPPLAESVAPLGLGIAAEADGLRLKWSKTASGLASARTGLVIIRDGDQQKEFPLNKEQLLVGNLFYTPLSEKVHFTLKVFANELERSDSIMARISRPNTREPVASPSPRTTVPLSARHPSKSLTSRPQVAANLPEPPPPTSPAAGAQIANIVNPAPVQPSVLLQSGLTTPLPMKEKIDPPLQIVAASAESRRDSHSQEPPQQSMQSSPATAVAPQPLPALSTPVPPVSPPSSVASVARPVEAYVPPQPLRQAKPVVPRSMKSLISHEIRVEVKLSIDASGKIVRAEARPGEGAIQASLAKLAVETARLWKFKPAHDGSHNVPGEVRVHFQFGPGN